MICFSCDNEEFSLKPDALIEQEFKGEVFKVETPAFACTKCGWLTLDTDTTDELRRRTADAYRKKHALLTSDEIRAYRQALGMNQKNFAAFVGVGEASVKRWETWLVQEKSSDELMRLKCEKELYQRLAQKAAGTVWVSVHYTATIQASNGVAIETTAPAAAAKPSRWDVDITLPEPEDQSQMKLCEQFIGPSICGLSPPGEEDVAFSLSAPCRKDVEKENATFAKN